MWARLYDYPCWTKDGYAKYVNGELSNLYDCLNKIHEKLDYITKRINEQSTGEQNKNVPFIVADEPQNDWEILDKGE